MTIPQKAFFHGAALYKITQDEHFSSINKMANVTSSSAYLLNHNTGIYIKVATVEYDTNTWRFTFAPQHQEVVRKIYDAYKELTYIILVCSNEGICVVNFDILTSCVDFNYTDSEWCEVYRQSGRSFRIAGAKGEYTRTIPLKSFPSVLFQ